MGCCICSIEALANGYEVSLRDPAKAKKSENSKGMGYIDPMVSYAFSDMDKMIDFIRTNLPKAAEGDDEYSSSFDSAAKDKS
jgi:hypothetical protein